VTGLNIALEHAYDYQTDAMCGRYTLTADLKKVADRFGAPMPEGQAERGKGKA
jgi:hypothetical protein